jgi:AcrR family transcriptional regulator
MPSPSSSIERPVPQQQRSSRRVAEYLDTAAGLFAEVGYEATTMTAIAERAGSSIGGLYRYFPDKPTLALALHRQYSQEVEGVWTPLFKEAKTLSATEFAERLMDRMADFAAKRPGYLPLLTSPIRLKRDAASRSNLRAQFSKAFVAKKPSLSQDEALLAANVAIQLMRGMINVCAESDAKRHPFIIREFKKALANYLSDVLRK